MTTQQKGKNFSVISQEQLNNWVKMGVLTPGIGDKLQPNSSFENQIAKATWNNYNKKIQDKFPQTSKFAREDRYVKISPTKNTTPVTNQTLLKENEFKSGKNNPLNETKKVASHSISIKNERRKINVNKVESGFNHSLSFDQQSPRYKNIFNQPNPLAAYFEQAKNAELKKSTQIKG